MALIVVQSFPNQQTLERSYPTKCPESDQPQLGHPLRSRGDTSLQTLPKVGTSLEKRDATLLLVQDLIPSFKSICLGLSLRGGVHYRHYSQGRGVMEPTLPTFPQLANQLNQQAYPALVDSFYALSETLGSNYKA